MVQVTFARKHTWRKLDGVLQKLRTTFQKGRDHLVVARALAEDRLYNLAAFFEVLGDPVPAQVFARLEMSGSDDGVRKAPQNSLLCQSNAEFALQRSNYKLGFLALAGSKQSIDGSDLLRL